MKKVLVSVVLVLVMVATVVSAAAGVNGQYDGYDIVKLKANGQTLAVEDVPAFVYKGRTMVPVGMLRQAGLEVIWNQDEYSVDVKTNAPSIDDQISLYRDIQSYRFFVTLTSQNDLLNSCINLMYYAETDEQYTYAISEVERIDTFYLYAMLSGAERWDYEDYEDLKLVVDSINAGKESLYNYDVTKADEYWYLAQITLNNIYNELDNRMIDHINVLSEFVMDENFDFVK